MQGLLNVSFIIIFFVSLIVSYHLGRYISRRQFARQAPTNITGHKIFEGAIFALMGLLVAFTFSNANQKMDQRRVLIIEEANAIGTAYLRIDLLDNAAQTLLRGYFRDYLSARLDIYKAIPDIELVRKSVSDSLAMQDKIWVEAVKACKNGGQQSICMLILPALNNMFDIATTRVAITQIHPPFAIFYLLIGLALLSCFLAGYDMEKNGEKKTRVFTLCYTIVMSITIYMIIDMEYPRLGLIQLTAFDNTLVELLGKMKNT